MKGIVKVRGIINDLVIQIICVFLYLLKASWRKLVIVSLHGLHIFLTCNHQFYIYNKHFLMLLPRFLSGLSYASLCVNPG